MMLNKIDEKEFVIAGKRFDGWLFLANFSSFMNFLLGVTMLFLFIFNISIAHHWFTRGIVFGASWDAIDGKFARRSKFKSRFGSQIDTYSDLVTFGLVPTMIIIDVLHSVNWIIAVICGLMYVYASSFRLSRFMIGGTGKSFSGMPTPVSAIFIGSLYILNVHWVIIAASAILISLIMVSSFTYTAMKSIDTTFDRVHFIFGITLMLLLTYIPTILIGYIAAIFVLYIYYFIFIGPLHATWRNL